MREDEKRDGLFVEASPARTVLVLPFIGKLYFDSIFLTPILYSLM